MNPGSKLPNIKKDACKCGTNSNKEFVVEYIDSFSEVERKFIEGLRK
jgi:hypothetical protein